MNSINLKNTIDLAAKALHIEAMLVTLTAWFSSCNCAIAQACASLGDLSTFHQFATKQPVCNTCADNAKCGAYLQLLQDTANMPCAINNNTVHTHQKRSHVFASEVNAALSPKAQGVLNFLRKKHTGVSFSHSDINNAGRVAHPTYSKGTFSDEKNALIRKGYIKPLANGMYQLVK